MTVIEPSNKFTISITKKCHLCGFDMTITSDLPEIKYCDQFISFGTTEIDKRLSNHIDRKCDSERGVI